MTIRRRLAIAAAVAVAVAVLIASAAAYLAVRSQLRGQIDSSLRDRAQAIEVLGRFQGGAPPGAPQSLRLPQPPQARLGGAPGIVQFITPAGTVRRPPGPKTIEVPLTPQARAVARGASEAELLQDQTVEGEDLRVLTEPLPDGGAVQVARPLGEVDSVLHELLLILVAIAVGGIALAALLGALVSRASLAPVRHFTEETESISGGADPTRRLPVETDDELGRLARSYNATLDALQRSSEAQRQMVSDASHELRTPLASLKTNLEILLRGGERLAGPDLAELERDLVEQIDDLTRLVDDVVELARHGEPERLLDDVDLAEIVAVEVERARREFPGLSFESRLESCVVRGVPERISRAVHNLLDNAAKWSPAEATVEVGLVAGVLSVRDHGPGFAEDDLPFVFDRFYRAANARSQPGSGLGLAIVRQTAEAHGGEVAAANAPGGGAVLTLRLPVERDDTAAAAG